MNQVLPSDNMQFNNELLAPSSEFVGGFGGDIANSSKTTKFQFEDLKQTGKNTGKNIEEIDFGLYQRHREAIIKVARDIGKLQAQDYSKERHELEQGLAGKVTDRTMGIIRCTLDKLLVIYNKLSS